MKYICAQPDELYYAWQVEVMLDNFLSVGIDPHDIHIVVGINKHTGEWWKKLICAYPEVGFFFYRDVRDRRGYAPSIRPFILYKHFERFKYLYKEVIFYHDCDILFTSIPDFSKFLKDDIWYVSDTRSYIGSEYIQTKGDDVYEKMTDFVGINPNIPIANEDSSGGAQYIMKNIHRMFWYHVYIYSEVLYKYLCSIDSDIQKWTADMWVLLWKAWSWGHKTKIDPYLNFSMASDTWPKWNTNLIYHNAGAVQEHDGILFRKDQFRDKLPYSDHNPYDKNFCSYFYFDHIIETGKTSCLIQKDQYEEYLARTKSLFI